MQAIITFLQTLWIPFSKLMSLFSSSAETSKETDVPSIYTRKKIEEALVLYYSKAVDPKVSFRVFHLRVTYFDWDLKEALNEVDNILPFTEINGLMYTPLEIYVSCKKPAVSYTAYKKRIATYKWSPFRALTDGSSNISN